MNRLFAHQRRYIRNVSQSTTHADLHAHHFIIIIIGIFAAGSSFPLWPDLYNRSSSSQSNFTSRSLQCLPSLASNASTVDDITTSSGIEFHTLTILLRQNVDTYLYSNSTGSIFCRLVVDFCTTSSLLYKKYRTNPQQINQWSLSHTAVRMSKLGLIPTLR